VTVVQRRIECADRVDLRAVLGPMRRGRNDPTFRLDDRGLWRTAITPEGAVLQLLCADRAGVTSSCWGDGAGWMDSRTPDLLGLHDDPGAFERLPAVAAALADTSAGDAMPPAGVSEIVGLWRSRGAGSLRIPKGHNVWESVVAAVLEQKVTGMEAGRAWIGLARSYGDPAPGDAPEGMLVFPTARQLRRVPSWHWRRLGVDRQRSDTLMRLAQVPHVLQRLPMDPPAAARRRLTSIPGVGEWTFAEVAQRALGDPDAVSVGDFHLAGEVVFALTGRLDGTDDQMLALLQPFAGQRYRAVRLLELAGVRKPRRGPRMAIPAHRYG
jgi:3-methyladenine DNA glycosylase/8-oxoguanine DNA glycosylase